VDRAALKAFRSMFRSMKHDAPAHCRGVVLRGRGVGVVVDQLPVALVHAEHVRGADLERDDLAVDVHGAGHLGAADVGHVGADADLDVLAGKAAAHLHRGFLLELRLDGLPADLATAEGTAVGDALAVLPHQFHGLRVAAEVRVDGTVELGVGAAEALLGRELLLRLVLGAGDLGDGAGSASRGEGCEGECGGQDGSGGEQVLHCVRG
jgi:hypothetical protein